MEGTEHTYLVGSNGVKLVKVHHFIDPATIPLGPSKRRIGIHSSNHWGEGYAALCGTALFYRCTGVICIEHRTCATCTRARERPYRHQVLPGIELT